MQIAFGLNIDSINKTDSELSESIAFVLKLTDNAVRDPLLKVNVLNILIKLKLN